MSNKAVRHREDLTGEHNLGDAGQFTLAALFGIVWVADTFFLNYTTFLNTYVPLWVRIPCGLAVLVAAGYLAKRGMAIVFGEDHETPCVIRNGVFRVVRHPVYLGEMLLYAGFLLMSFSLSAAVIAVVAALFLHYISRYEEQLLLARFGDDYAQYMKDVPMWIPRLLRGERGQ
jgi:protein-S-isoprenylcysteine O-methyltransferase Ste14